jgi:chromate transporter
VSGPSIRDLFLCFTLIGMQGWGGGLSVWMRREVVLRRGWMEERAFLAGLALSQVAPGPNAINLAVFIGTVLRGRAGAAAAFAGIVGLPALLVLAMGYAYFSTRGLPGGERLGAALSGVRLTRRNVRSAGAACVTVFTAVGVGLLGWPLLPVLLAAVPVSLFLTRGGRA